MSPEAFTYWLQGYSELAGERPTEAQWKSIQEHLKLVFVKMTPPVKVDFTEGAWQSRTLRTFDKISERTTVIC